MDIVKYADQLADAYTKLAPIGLAIIGFIIVAAPIVGRLVAAKWPRAGEALIRFGSDVKGAAQARGLPVDAPAPSAAPLAQKPKSPGGDGPSSGGLPPSFPTTPPSSGGPMARLALAVGSVLDIGATSVRRRARIQRMGGSLDADWEAIRGDWERVAGGHGLLVMAIFCFGCTPILSGCAGGAGQMQRFVDTTVETIPLVDDQLHRSYDRELAACPDVTCVDRVEREWRPVFVGLQAIRDVWCAVAPEAEGC